MKKTMFLILVLILSVSCSSNRISSVVNAQREAIEDMVKEDKIIGNSLPSWIYKNGIEGGNVYAVGAAEFSADKSPLYIRKAALMDAEVKLLSDAPADFRILTQNAMTGAGIDSAEFYQIQTKLQEVIGLTGIKHSLEKATCRKMIRYGELSTRVTRICYVQVYIPVRELVKAYKRTLAYKFGQPAAEMFNNIMNEELQRINKNPLLKQKENKDVKKITSLPNNKRLNNNRNNGTGQDNKRRGLSTGQHNSIKVQYPDSNRRYISASSTKARRGSTEGRIPTTDKAGKTINTSRQKL